MEWKDILSLVVPLGLMVVMMRFGGCCGGHSHGGAEQGNYSAGGCCGANKNSGPTKEPEKKACH